MYSKEFKLKIIWSYFATYFGTYFANKLMVRSKQIVITVFWRNLLGQEGGWYWIKRYYFANCTNHTLICKWWIKRRLALVVFFNIVYFCSFIKALSTNSLTNIGSPLKHYIILQPTHLYVVVYQLFAFYLFRHYILTFFTTEKSIV